MFLRGNPVVMVHRVYSELKKKFICILPIDGFRIA